jgi:RNA polymerase sigma-70 factor, ECF subfamily
VEDTANTFRHCADSFYAMRRTNPRTLREAMIGTGGGRVTNGGFGPGLTDEQWVRALQRREAWAWDLLQQRTLEPVFAYVHRHCRRREDAEDLTAEVYAAAVASIDRFRGEAGVITWLIAIARRKLVDAARRAGRRPEILEADMPVVIADMAPETGWQERGAAESPEAALERRETAAHVRRLVQALPEAQREALLLRCVDQLSLAEVGRVLGRTENAVKGLLQRAKNTVLQRLNDEASDRSRNTPQEPHHAGPFAQSTCPTAPPPAE